MSAGRSTAVPVCGWLDRAREPAGRLTAAPPVALVRELDVEDPEPPDEVPHLDDVAEDDPLELVPDPDRGDADPVLPLDEAVGVLDPVGVCARGGSTTRAGSGALLDPVEPVLDAPDEPDPDPDPVVPLRGIACPAAAAGKAMAIARATIVSERGFLSMSMHSFSREDPTGPLRHQTLQQYCHQWVP